MAASDSSCADWFFLDAEGTTKGPHSWSQLMGMHTSGALSASCLVWSHGWPDWTPLSNLITPSEEASASASASGTASPGSSNPSPAIPSNPSHADERSTPLEPHPSEGASRDHSDAPSERLGGPEISLIPESAGRDAAGSVSGGRRGNSTSTRPASDATLAPEEEEEDEELRRFTEEVRKAEAEAEAAKRGKRRKRRRGDAQEAPGIMAGGGIPQAQAHPQLPIEARDPSQAGAPGAEEEDEEEEEGEGMEDERDGVEGASPALGADVGATRQGSGENGDAVGEGEGGGPDEGEEFEDDDGTRYKWSSALRAWVPQDEGIPPLQSGTAAGGEGSLPGNGHVGPAGVPGQQYDPALMTFEVEEEAIPSLADAIAASARPEVGGQEDEKPGPSGRGTKSTKGEKVGRLHGRGGPDAGDRGPGVAEDGANEGQAGLWGEMKDEQEEKGAKGGKRGKNKSDEGQENGAAKGKGGKGEGGGDKGEGGNGSQQPEGWFELKVNTSVYIQGLPEDVTEEEVVEVFSKCGVIKEDLESGKPRVKLYRDRESGRLKGDGLVTFLKVPSVDLAIRILDGSPLRLGDSQPMSVSLATFQQKGGVFVKKSRLANDKKKKLMKKLEQKALGWGGFDDAKVTLPVTVILKHMFTRDELVADPSLPEELEAEISAECSKIGPLEKVKVYSNHPEGVVSVRFKDRDDGRKCIDVMNGRWFGGRQVEAFEDTGLIKWGQVRDEEEEARRLELFGSELEDD